MSSGSAREMRRVLEQIKDFARHSKLAHRTEELSSQTTLDLIEQKLSNHIVRNFRRWVNKEHKDKAVTVDLLIAFLQDETELEERLQKDCISKHKSVISFKVARKSLRVCCRDTSLCSKAALLEIHV